MIRALALAPLLATALADDEASWRIERQIDVAPVWSGHPVGFCLLTHGEKQFAAYYDAQRRMTVASRALDSDQWSYSILPSKLGWDSHNYITMTVDDDGFIQL